MDQESRSHGTAGYIVFGITLLFLFYEFFLRVFPSIMVDELMNAFSVDALSLGTLSAFYFYSYAPMQLPVGMLMDRYGVRSLLTIASITCAAGCFIFAIASNLSFAELGRFFMGVGSSFAFVGMVYVVSHWFEEKKRALLVGVGNSVGILGAAFGEGPLSLITNVIGWRETILSLGIAGAVIAVLCFLALRHTKGVKTVIGDNHESMTTTFNGFQDVCMNTQGWLNSVGSLLFYLTTGTFAGLWAVPFLQTVHGLSKEYAAFSITIFFFGTIFGGPILGSLSDYFAKRKHIIYLSIIPAALLMIPLIYLPFLPVWIIYLIFFALGFFSGAQLLTFSLAVELNDISVKGSAIALTNFVVAVGGSIMQPGVGYLLDLHAGIQSISAHLPQYSIHDYQFAMLTFPIALLLSVGCFLLINEKKGNQAL